jgi:ribonuclease VapC
VIVVDTSAIVAILFQEESAPSAAKALADSSARYFSAANWMEAAVVVEARKGADASLEYDALIDAAGIEVVAVTDDVARAARIAWRRYGKGRHPAGLNFGDCFSYGLAKVRDLPLLAIGDDFSKTDLVMAIGGDQRAPLT